MTDYRRERESIRWLIDEELYKYLSTIQACIAGGCITSIFTGQDISDIDIFFRTPEDYEKAEKYLKRCANIHYQGTKVVCETDKAKTFSMNFNKKFHHAQCDYGMSFYRDSKEDSPLIIQIVRGDVNHGEPEDIINKFDITACQAAYDFKTDQFVFGSRFFQDNTLKRIVINPECKNVLGMFYRVQKYIDKGYKVSPREYIKIGMLLMNKNYKTYRDFTEDMKMCFQDSLMHHCYSKIRYPTGTKCEESESILDNKFDPLMVVEWIEEFNAVGPHYPVKEGTDMKSEKPEKAGPKFDESGNVIEQTISAPWENWVNYPATIPGSTASSFFNSGMGKSFTNQTFVGGAGLPIGVSLREVLSKKVVDDDYDDNIFDNKSDFT